MLLMDGGPKDDRLAGVQGGLCGVAKNDAQHTTTSSPIVPLLPPLPDPVSGQRHHTRPKMVVEGDATPRRRGFFCGVEELVYICAHNSQLQSHIYYCVERSKEENTCMPDFCLVGSYASQYLQHTFLFIFFLFLLHGHRFFCIMCDIRLSMCSLLYNCTVFAFCCTDRKSVV